MNPSILPLKLWWDNGHLDQYVNLSLFNSAPQHIIFCVQTTWMNSGPWNSAADLVISSEERWHQDFEEIIMINYSWVQSLQWSLSKFWFSLPRIHLIHVMCAFKHVVWFAGTRSIQHAVLLEPLIFLHSLSDQATSLFVPKSIIAGQADTTHIDVQRICACEYATHQRFRSKPNKSSKMLLPTKHVICLRD